MIKTLKDSYKDSHQYSDQDSNNLKTLIKTFIKILKDYYKDSCYKSLDSPYKGLIEYYKTPYKSLIRSP